MNKLFDVLWDKIIVGSLYLDEEKNYVFKYDKSGVLKAKEKGFTYIIGFPHLNRKYVSNNLFAVFSSRVIPRNRKNIKEILEKYGMEEYDEIELLKKTNGKCITDKIEIQ